MISTSKKEDKEMQLEVSEMIQALVRTGNKEAIDLAEKFGETYLALSERIKHHDYSKEDEIRNRADKRIDDYYKNKTS